MNHSNKLATLKLMIALLLAVSAQAQVQHPPNQQLSSPDAIGTTTQGQTNWQEAGEVRLDMKRTCNQSRQTKEELVSLDKDKEYAQADCFLKEEERRDPKNKPEVSGWKCELNKQTKKVKVTAYLNKHPECAAGDTGDERVSYLQVTLTVKVVEAKKNPSPPNSNQPQR